MKGGVFFDQQNKHFTKNIYVRGHPQLNTLNYATDNIVVILT